jgi:hypothetical protein
MSKVLVDRELLCQWEGELDQIAGAGHISDKICELLAEPVQQQEPVGYTTAGMIECIKALPFTGRIGVRAEKTARWSVPLFTSPYQEQSAWDKAHDAYIDEMNKHKPAPADAYKQECYKQLWNTVKDQRDELEAALAAARVKPCS